MFQLLFIVYQQEETKVLPLVKQEEVEGDDCNLDLKVEVNIRAEGECGSAHDSITFHCSECFNVSLY